MTKTKQPTKQTFSLDQLRRLSGDSLAQVTGGGDEQRKHIFK